MIGKLHTGGVENKETKMSDLIAVITVCGEKMVCIDYDRPVWQSPSNVALRAVPNLNHFVVDGILACLSGDTLKKYGITQRFNSNEFQMDPPPYELKLAREILYLADDLEINYFHESSGDVQIHEDLGRFKMPISNVEKVSTQQLIDLSK